MSCIIYYSNHCDKSKTVLTTLSKSRIQDDIHFLCIDKRVRSGPSSWHIVTESGEKVLLPPQVNRVPALLLLNKGHQVLYGDQILQHFQPKNTALNAAATNYNGEPNAFSIGRESMGGYGVASDNYSFLDQTADELSAKGNGGMRQMYNYATIDIIDKIETPPDDYSPDKVGSVSLEQLQQQRNLEIKNSNNGNNINSVVGGDNGNNAYSSNGHSGFGNENVVVRPPQHMSGGGGLQQHNTPYQYQQPQMQQPQLQQPQMQQQQYQQPQINPNQRGQPLPQPQQYAPIGTPPQQAAAAVYRAPPQQTEYSRLSTQQNQNNGSMRGMDVRPQPRGGGSWI
jgi:hypothetical protein